MSRLARAPRKFAGERRKTLVNLEERRDQDAEVRLPAHQPLGVEDVGQKHVRQCNRTLPLDKPPHDGSDQASYGAASYDAEHYPHFVGHWMSRSGSRNRHGLRMFLFYSGCEQPRPPSFGGTF